MRVVIAEDSVLLREGMVALLQEHDIEVVAQADDGDGLLRIVAGHKPDLAIVDVRLPPTFTDEGIRAALEARRRHPDLSVLVLSQYVEPVYTGELLASGESGVGYLLKERVGEVRSFLDAVHRVAGGGTALDREVIASLVARADAAAGEDALAAADPARARDAVADRAGPHQRRHRPRAGRSRSAPSRSTSPTSSESSTSRPPTTITAASWRCWPTSGREGPGAADRPRRQSGETTKLAP